MARSAGRARSFASQQHEVVAVDDFEAFTTGETGFKRSRRATRDFADFGVGETGDAAGEDFAVGIEDIEDLVADLAEALATR